MIKKGRIIMEPSLIGVYGTITEIIAMRSTEYSKILSLNTQDGIVNIVVSYKIKLSYNKKYFNTNNTAKIYISGVIFFALPETRLITTYEITPMAIPSEMLYINGIAIKQR